MTDPQAWLAAATVDQLRRPHDEGPDVPLHLRYADSHTEDPTR